MTLGPLSVNPRRVLPKIPHGTVNPVGEVYGHCSWCQMERWLKPETGLCGTCTWRKSDKRK